jgi:hypothetical protein
MIYDPYEAGDVTVRLGMIQRRGDARGYREEREALWARLHVLEHEEEGRLQRFREHCARVGAVPLR